MSDIVPYSIQFTGVQLLTIENLAAVNYRPSQISLYLGVNKRAFKLEYDNPDSLVREAYDRGQLTAQFEIDNAMLEAAKTGNLTATQIFDKHSEANKLENLKKRILYGDEA